MMTSPPRSVPTGKTLVQWRVNGQESALTVDFDSLTWEQYADLLYSLLVADWHVFRPLWQTVYQ